MERLKCERKVIRRLFTRCAHEVEEALRSKNKSELSAFISKLEKHYEDLLRIQNSMMTFLLDAEDRDEEEIEKDVDLADTYEKRWFILRQQSKELIKDKSLAGSSSNDTVNSLGDLPSKSAKSTNRRRIKLPKFKLPVFDGEVKNWIGFWSQFKKIDDDQTDLDNDDKMHYLLQAMQKGSSARELVESFPPCGANYEKAVQQLKNRFAKDELIIDYYVRELLQLVIAKNVSKHPTRVLYDRIMTQILALESLGLTQDKYAAFLYPLVESALPDDILRAWNRSRVRAGELIKSLESLMDFVRLEVESEERIRVAHFGNGESLGYNATASCLTTSNEKNDIEKSKRANENKKDDCIWCEKGFHRSSECKIAMSMTLEQRNDFLKKNGICFVCLRKGHTAKFCRGNPKCIICGRRHYTLMCRDMPIRSVKTHNTKEKEMVLNQSESNKIVLLQTLKVKISHGTKSIQVRALLDSGAQRSFIKSNIASKLNLEPIGEYALSHNLFGGRTTKERHYRLFNFNVSSLNNSYNLQMTALEQPILCGYLPKLRQESIINSLKLKGVELTDCIDDQSEICLLIGSDILGTLLTGRTERVDDKLLAMETRLGWTIQGPAVGVYCSTNTVNTLHASFTYGIENFWQLETLGIRDESEMKSVRLIESEVQDYFKRTVCVNDEGRYEVRLPWKETSKILDSNYDLALKRLTSTSKRLTHLGILDDYDTVFKEWLESHIIEEVDKDDYQSGHYMPHHAVIRDASLTTKIRPVFDASALDKNGFSLNSCLEKGANLIELIPRLIIQFRKHEIGITADIKKAFLQISLYPPDRDYLKFLWWRNINESPRVLKTFRHRRVVFGVTTSPYLLSATILHHLKNYDSKTAAILRKSFYVDNCVVSVRSIGEMHAFIEEATKIMLQGKFELRGWVTGPNLVDEEVVSTSVLGLIWNPRKDFLNCKILPVHQTKLTKRFLLSVAQSIFDPLGFLCPSTILPKVLIQKCWIENLDWDERLPDDLSKHAEMWLRQMNLLGLCQIPRRLSIFDLSLSTNSIHVFCDACQSSYACCVFLRSEYQESVFVQLVMAKSRVAPSKGITIPRIELLGALMAARLASEVKDSLGLSCIGKEVYWTDSSVVLSWIKKQTGFNIFVHNRVKEIVSRTKAEDWRHIPGDLNPADLPSRGCNPQVLYDSKWWDGPLWLKKSSEEWPKSIGSVEEGEVLKELKIFSVAVKERDLFSNSLLYFNDYRKIIRMVGWCLRFIYNSRRNVIRKKGDLSSNEIKVAENKIFKLLQVEHFTKEGHKELKLELSLDSEGLLRVKTRLTFSGESDTFVSPVLLPKVPIVERLVARQHLNYLHAGSGTLFAKLREFYWIIGCRKLANKVVHECVVCKRFRVKACSAPVPPLPADRDQCGAPFEVTGIDFAGPLHLRTGEKCWIALFTCATYRAVHLELCLSLSTEEFLLALRRFLARRGNVRAIYSDNGSNFKGAVNIIDWQAVEKNSGNKVVWRFIPPAAPWWGGFWERMVRTVKGILRRVLGKAALNFNEMVTVLCEVEEIVNSRPLTYVVDSSENVLPLTPALFLRFQKSSENNLEIELVDKQILSSRWRYMKKLGADLKQRFRSEYLGLLAAKLNNNRHLTLKPGDIVLIETNDRKRIQWPLGIVTEVLEGVDGISRAARVKTVSGEILRSFPSIYPLELSCIDTENCIKHSNARDRRPGTVNPVGPIKTRSGRLVSMPEKLTF